MDNSIKIKKRNAGIDLVRLIAMFCIIINHFLFIGNILKKYPKYQKQLIYLHILTDWHNNGFALISGIVGFKSNRYSNLLYLWITVFFYSFGIHAFTKIFIKKFIIIDDISIEFFPIIFKRYWYFTAYFGMYLFLPVINKGISFLSKSELKSVVISTLGIFAFWKDFKNPKKDVFNMKSGSSTIWLLTFYLTGAYIGKYRVVYFGLKKYIFCFICFFIYLSSSYLYIKIKIDNIFLGKGVFLKELNCIFSNILTTRFDSFLKIVQSITVCLFFLQLNYNKYIHKTICFLGPLIFGIYLIHIHPIIWINIIKHIFDNESKELNLIPIIITVFRKSLKMFVFCILIDYIRFLIFKLLRIKELCIILDSVINTYFL